MKNIPTLEQAKKVLEIVDAGLVSGLGDPVPGQMCIEAAVCFALGEPHGDDPSCVSSAVRSFKIRLNDSRWSSPAARAKGMRQLAIAQLGSRNNIDETAFCAALSKLTIQRVLPPILRKIGLEKKAAACEQDGNILAANYAADAAANAARYAASDAAANVARYAAAAADAAAAAAADAADAAHYAAAADAADAARYAAAAAAARYTADAARYTAAAAARYTAAADAVLSISANCCLDALREVKAPGIALLDRLGI